MKKGLEKNIDVVAGVFDNTMLNVRQCNGLEISREPFYVAVSIYHRLAEVFNQCENSNQVLFAFKHWESVHPLMKVIPVAWNYGMPFGLLYSKNPDKKVQKVRQNQPDYRRCSCSSYAQRQADWCSKKN